MTLLAEDLLLLLLDDVTGKARTDRTRLDYALGGALLLELAMAGAIVESQPGGAVKRGRIVIADAGAGMTATGDAELDAALHRVAAKPVKPERLIGPLSKGLRGRLLERLAAQGSLRSEHAKLLGIFPSTRWPAADSRGEAAVRRELDDVLVNGTSPQPRVAALVSLLHAIGAVPKVVSGEKRALKARAKEISEGEWAGEAVRKAVAAVNAAVVAAVVTSTVATSGS